MTIRAWKSTHSNICVRNKAVFPKHYCNIINDSVSVMPLEKQCSNKLIVQIFFRAKYRQTKTLRRKQTVNLKYKFYRDNQVLCVQETYESSASYNKRIIDNNKLAIHYLDIQCTYIFLYIFLYIHLYLYILRIFNIHNKAHSRYELFNSKTFYISTYLYIHTLG